MNLVFISRVLSLEDVKNQKPFFMYTNFFPPVHQFQFSVAEMLRKKISEN